MVMGTPGKVVRQLGPEERAGLRAWAEKYIHVARAHSVLQEGTAGDTPVV